MAGFAGFHCAVEGHLGRQFDKLGPDRGGDGIHPHTHVLGHGVGRGVIGAERGTVTAPGPLVVGIERAAEQISDEAHLRLGQRDHIRVGTVRRIAHHEGILGLEDLDV
jgi:hypothetical protein